MYPPAAANSAHLTGRHLASMVGISFDISKISRASFQASGSHALTGSPACRGYPAGIPLPRRRRESARYTGSSYSLLAADARLACAALIRRKFIDQSAMAALSGCIFGRVERRQAIMRRALNQTENESST